MGLSSAGFEGNPGGFAQILQKKKKILGQKEIVIERKTFQIITELVKRRFRATLVARPREKTSWIALWLYGMAKLVKGFKDCSRFRIEDPFESFGREDDKAMELERRHNGAGAFLLVSIHDVEKKYNAMAIP